MSHQKLAATLPAGDFFGHDVAETKLVFPGTTKWPRQIGRVKQVHEEFPSYNKHI